MMFVHWLLSFTEQPFDPCREQTNHRLSVFVYFVTFFLQHSQDIDNNMKVSKKLEKATFC